MLRFYVNLFSSVFFFLLHYFNSKMTEIHVLFFTTFGKIQFEFSIDNKIILFARYFDSYNKYLIFLVIF